jgi:hexosaminidase
MKRLSIYILFFISQFIFSQSKIELSLIPLPNKCILQKEEFRLSKSTLLFSNNKRLAKHVAYFAEQLKKNNRIDLIESKTGLKNNFVQFELNKLPNKSAESYHLSISQKGVLISGDTSGIFYGIQTLLQIINDQKGNKIILPCIEIEDEPRFNWRGMHLDVCRHFFPISFVKRYIDFLAMYKLNTFHWHLTEDQGWRIEIKKYPLLTEVGAFRKGSMIGAYSETKFDTIRYGGYYTQEEIKEVVKYAQERQITIVPEIEMPGHSQAAIAAYPWLSCSGKKQEVAKGWGVFEDVYCTKDSTLQFLKDVLDEVLTLFPGKYIHIGGDECPKTRWKQCVQCQSIIKKENLKDEHELQSYFIKRIENYVNSKGRQIIGWDEILEGGLAPNAAVMSWRGEEGGIAAAKQKHNVVMSPGTHCYFDHYQAAPADEPLAIGGYTPLDKVYAYEPIPKELNLDEQKYIMGAQGNVWTEYILNEKQVEYMSMPRMAALAEVLWTQPETKDETNFLTRLEKHFLLLDKMNVNYAKVLYQIGVKIRNDLNPQSLFLELIANKYLGDIHYTLDGSEPNYLSKKYTEPLILNNDISIKCALFKEKEQKGKTTTKQYQVNKATNKKLSFKTEPSKYYNKGGGFVLVNSESGKVPRVNEQWLGWSGDDLEVTIDMERIQEFNTVEIGFLKEELNWIYLPKEAVLFVSDDGNNFKEIKSIEQKDFLNERTAVFNLNNIKTQFVKILAKNNGKIKTGMPGAGEDAWLFSDEIKIK